jgi:hypothetical protein
MISTLDNVKNIVTEQWIKISWDEFISLQNYPDFLKANIIIMINNIAFSSIVRATRNQVTFAKPGFYKLPSVFHIISVII